MKIYELSLSEALESFVLFDYKDCPELTKQLVKKLMLAVQCVNAANDYEIGTTEGFLTMLNDFVKTNAFPYIYNNTPFFVTNFNTVTYRAPYKTDALLSLYLAYVGDCVLRMNTPMRFGTFLSRHSQSPVDSGYSALDEEWYSKSEFATYMPYTSFLNTMGAYHISRQLLTSEYVEFIILIELDDSINAALHSNDSMSQSLATMLLLRKERLYTRICRAHRTLLSLCKLEAMFRHTS